MAKQKDYRLKIVCPVMGNISFIVREGKNVCYMSASEVPLALSNLVQSQSAELRFALKDAFDGAEAAKATRLALTRAFPNADLGRLSKVQVL